MQYPLEYYKPRTFRDILPKVWPCITTLREKYVNQDYDPYQTLYKILQYLDFRKIRKGKIDRYKYHFKIY